MHLFYAPEAGSEFFYLPPDESQHCVKVLRFRTGDSLRVTNGRGLMVEGKLETEHPESVMVRTTGVISSVPALPFQLHIAMSPLKNMSRFEWFVEKAAELRVAEITPLICKRTEKTGIRTDRLRKITLEAMKQSVSGFLTTIHEPVKFENFIHIPALGYSRYIASCSDAQKLMIPEMNGTKLQVLIGPEGDFTDVENEQAVNAGFLLLGLGESRLRTETAGMLTAAYVYSNFMKQ